jgi:transcriptional regulator with XRE-family HTH domain
MSEQISVNVKVTQLRESRSLSREQLAELSGLPLELIEQIETGGLIPGLSPLLKIARALGVRLGTFLDGEEQAGPVVSRRNHLASAPRFAGGTRTDRSGMDFYALAPGKTGRNMEPFIVEARPDADVQLSTHEGEELLYILEGHVELLYGKESYKLEPGDSIYYDSVVPHQVRAVQAPAKLLAVVYAPF